MFFAKLYCFFVFAMMCVSPVVFADNQTELPAGGTLLIDASSLVPTKLNVNSGGDLATHSVVKSSTLQGAPSIKVDITGQPSNTWDISVNKASTTPVKKDDALVASFWVRGTAKSGQGGGVTEFVFEKAGAPYTKSIQYLVETPRDGSWQHYWVAFKSLEDYDAGGSLITFQLGYLRQEIELAKIEVWNFGQRDLAGLPHTPLSYIGRQESAPWREEALQRIEKIRKADLELQIVGADGKPAVGQTVHAELDRHSFGFGCAANSWQIVGKDDDAKKYREIFKENFNVGTLENGLKWPFWDEKPEYRDQTIDSLHWLKENNIKVRGHVMVWAGQGHIPNWVRALKDQPKSLRPTVAARIREMSYLTRGIAEDWDVINEGFDNHDLMDWLGDEAMVEWFKEADAASPDCDLYYNDYAALVRGGHPTGHKEHFEKTIKYLIDNGAPIDGIGIQGHFGSLLTPPFRILKELDHWGSYNKKIMITEFDVIVPDEALRVDFMRDFLITCFSHESVDGVVIWGFWAGAHWMPQAALYDQNWELTKMGQQWQQLKKQWHTDETLTTDNNGMVKLRGFIGDYKIESGGRTFDVTLPKSGSIAKLTLSDEK